jgi:hypothetical protein
MTNTKTHKTNRRLARRTLVVMALGVAALMAVPASGFAATSFGAKLNQTIQPSNSLPAQACVMGMPQQCTRIEMDAYNNAGHERAPKDGVIKKVKLIAGGPGHFKLQIAEAKPDKDKGRVVRNGPRIDYNGQPNNQGLTYDVESFPVHVPVEKGQYLAIKAKKTSMLRCSSGGPNQFLFQPALSPGGPFKTLSYTDGCWLLLQAVYQ